MELYLIVAKGQKAGEWIHIKTDLFVMGSDPTCQLRCRLPEMGKKHCAIVQREKKRFIRDLDSGGLTYVNERVVPPDEEWPLHNRDTLIVGPLEFRVRFMEGSLGLRDEEDWGLKQMDRLDEMEEEALYGTATARGKPPTPSEAAKSILAKIQAERGVVHGRLRVGLEGGVTTIRFNDSFLVDEAELMRVRQELFEHLLRPNLRVLFDFKEVRRLSSQAVQMFNILQQRLLHWGSSVALCRVTPDLNEYMKKLKILTNVPQFKDKETALKEPW